METPAALINTQARLVIPLEQGDASSTPPDCQNTDSRQLPHSYLCSQLVGAALLEMGVVREEVGEPWSWLLPTAFGQGGAVEKGLAEGVTLGEEVSVVFNRCLPQNTLRIAVSHFVWRILGGTVSPPFMSKVLLRISKIEHRVYICVSLAMVVSLKALRSALLRSPAAFSLNSYSGS